MISTTSASGRVTTVGAALFLIRRAEVTQFVEPGRLPAGQLQRPVLRDCSCGVDPHRSGEGDDVLGQAGEPSERDVERRRAVVRGDLGEHRIGGSTRARYHTAERPIRQDAQPIVHAVADDAAQKVLVVPQAGLDLDGVDLDDPSRLFDLAHGDVAESDTGDETLTLQIRKRAHARRQRNALVWSVKLVEVDPRHAECAATGFGRRRQMLGATIWHPAPAGPRHASLGRDDNPG